MFSRRFNRYFLKAFALYGSGAANGRPTLQLEFPELPWTGRWARRKRDERDQAPSKEQAHAE